MLSVIGKTDPCMAHTDTGERVLYLHADDGICRFRQLHLHD